MNDASNAASSGENAVGPAETDMEILTTMRHDPVNVPGPSSIYLLDYHHGRLLESANRIWGSTHTVKEQSWMTSASTFSTFVHEHLHDWQTQHRSAESASESTRIRLTVSRTSEATFTFTPTADVSYETLCPTSLSAVLASRDAAQWTLHLDPQRTAPFAHSITKTTVRSAYDGARTRVGLDGYGKPEDVILVSTEGKVIETSISSVYLYLERQGGGKWVTPSVSGSGCQDGVTRRWALEQGLCVEGDVDVGWLKEGMRVCVSNGVRGFGVGNLAGVAESGRQD